jgi:ribosomal-protein-alanine N-acetyltransferase
VTIRGSHEEQKRPGIIDLGDIRLRPLRPGDELQLLAYLTDPMVTEHTSIATQTLESLTAAVRRDIAAFAEGTSFRLALADPDDRLIGICGLNSWSSVHRHAELAYDLAPEFWGRGYMRRAVNALLAWAISELALNRVHAFVMTTNARSIRLLEQSGFTREGTLRRFRIARGAPRDFHVYAILATEFVPQRR